MRLSTKVATAHLQPSCEKHRDDHISTPSEAMSNNGMRPAIAAERDPVHKPVLLFSNTAVPEDMRSTNLVQQ